MRRKLPKSRTKVQKVRRQKGKTKGRRKTQQTTETEEAKKKDAANNGSREN